MVTQLLEAPRPTTRAMTAPTSEVWIPVKADGAERALRVLRLQQEIEDDVVRLVRHRVSYAAATGRIAEAVKTQVLGKYLAHQRQVDKQIEHTEKKMRIHELEDRYNQLVHAFNIRFAEITHSIERTRTMLGRPPKRLINEHAENGSLTRHMQKSPQTTVLENETIRQENVLKTFVTLKREGTK